MSTQLFFGPASGFTTSDQVSLGTNAAKLDGTASGWSSARMLTARGSGVTSFANTTVAGPTNGIEVETASLPVHWISAPLDADVTISGTITFNLWAGEAAMADNVAINCIIERIDSTGAIVSTIVQTARTTEVAVIPRTVNNFTATPTSTNMLKGDRLRFRVYGDDAGTMAAGGNTNFGFNGTTAAADGDSYVSFTETFGFLTSDPSTTTVYPTTTVSDIDPGGAGTDTKEMWTTQGNSIVATNTNTAAGWTAPIQATVSAGANLVEWFTKPLTAFTLSGPVLVNMRANESNVAANVSVRAELAVTANDGSGATVWAATTHPSEVPTGGAIDHKVYLAGDDTAVANGQRLRFRVYLDDTSTAAMAASFASQMGYNDATGTTGDTYLIFGQTLTEFVAAAGLPSLVMAPRLPA